MVFSSITAININGTRSVISKGVSVGIMEREDMNENIISEPVTSYIPHPGGIGCAMFEKMWENQDRVAQVDVVTQKEETFISILLKSIRAAIKISSKGINRKDIITICSTPSMEVCIPYIASVFRGIIPTTLDPSLSISDMVHLIKQVKPKLVFAGPESVEIMEKVLKEASLSVEIVVLGTTSTHTPFSDYLQSSPEEDDFKPTPVESLKDTLAILFSSGTTGLPKGICLSHLSFFHQCRQTGLLQQSYKLLTFGSFYWISTINILISSMLQGFGRIVVPKFDLQSFWGIVDKFQPSMIFLSPSLVVMILKVERQPSVKKLSLKLVMLSGGSISEKHIRAFQEVVPEAIVTLAYAQTELTGPATLFKFNNPEELALLREKPTSSGTVMPGYSFKIVDVDTEKILGPNQKGELRIKSDYIMTGYYNMDSSDSFDSDGWLKTGDIAYYDEDHCFFIVDRLKEVLKYRGYQIVPAVIEEVLLKHPAVEATVVFGIPNDEDGEHPTALVVLSKESKGVTSEEIGKFVEDRLSDAQKLRGGVRIVDRIPLTITGKVRRRELRDKFINGEL